MGQSRELRPENWERLRAAAEAADLTPDEYLSRLLDAAQAPASDQPLTQAQYQELVVQESPALLAVSTPEGQILYASPASEGILGYPPQEVIGRNASEFIPPEEYERVRASVAVAEPSGEQTTARYPRQHKDGSLRWLETQVRGVEVQGRPLLVGVLRDVTRLVQEEMEVAKMQRLYRVVVEQNRDAIILVDAALRFAYASPVVEAISGYKPEELLGRPLVELLHPDDAVLASTILSDIRAGEVYSNLRSRVICKDGRARWIEPTIAPLNLPDEEGLMLIVTVRDIDQQMAQQAEMSFLASLPAHIMDAVISTDAEFRVRTWNAGAERIYGWTAEEIIGKSLPEYLQSDFSTNTREDAVKVLWANGSWYGYAMQRTRSGELRRIYLSVATIRDARGEIIGTVGINRDETEQYRLEQERDELLTREHEERLFLELMLDWMQYWSTLGSASAVLDGLLDALRVIVPHEVGLVALLDDGELRIEARSGYEAGQEPGPELLNWLMQRVRFAFDHNHAVWFSGYVEDAEWQARASESGLKYLLAVPLLEGEQMAGLLALEKRDEDFSEKQAQWLRLMAQQAGVVIQNARYYEVLAQSLDELSALYQVSSVLFEKDDPETLAAEVVQVLYEQFPLKACRLALLDEGEKTLQCMAQVGTSEEECDGHAPSEALRAAVMEAIASREVLEHRSEIGNELVVPLRIPRRSIGALVFVHEEDQPFPERLKRVLTTFAERAAFALESLRLRMNMRRYAETLEERVEERTSELRRYSQRVDAILNSTSDAIVLTSPDGRIEQANRAFNEMFGYEPDELFDKPLYTVIADGGAVDLASLGNLAEHQRYLELTGMRKGGREIDLEVGWNEVRRGSEVMGIVYSLRDVSAQKAIERELFRSVTRFRGLFDRNNDAVLMIDLELRILDANDQALRMLGFMMMEEIVGRSYVEFVVPEEREEVDSHRERLISGESISIFERRIRCSDGRVLVTEVAAGLIYDADGMPLHIQVILRDISARKAMEEEMRQSLERERELSALKSRFISVVSHEFRTPLTTILASTELLRAYQERMSEEKRVGHLDKVKAQVQRLTQLMEDVLVFSRAEARGFDFRPQPGDLLEFCTSFIEDTQMLSPRRDDILIKATPPGNWQVLFDENLVRLILNNLLSNAMKYSQVGSPIEITLTRAGQNALLSVRDQGIGIPEEDQKHLFTHFHRAGNVGTIPGTGLGLAIVRMAVDACGGHLELESAENRGSTFTAHLPLLSSAPPVIPAGQPENPQ